MKFCGFRFKYPYDVPKSLFQFAREETMVRIRWIYYCVLNCRKTCSREGQYQLDLRQFCNSSSAASDVRCISIKCSSFDNRGFESTNLWTEKIQNGRAGGLCFCHQGSSYKQLSACSNFCLWVEVDESYIR